MLWGAGLTDILKPAAKRKREDRKAFSPKPQANANPETLKTPRGLVTILVFMVLSIRSWIWSRKPVLNGKPGSGPWASGLGVQA